MVPRRSSADFGGFRFTEGRFFFIKSLGTHWSHALKNPRSWVGARFPSGLNLKFFGRLRFNSCARSDYVTVVLSRFWSRVPYSSAADTDYLASRWTDPHDDWVRDGARTHRTRSVRQVGGLEGRCVRFDIFHKGTSVTLISRFVNHVARLS